MPTTSTTSLAGLLSPPTALSNCFIPVKYVFLLTCGFATPTIFKTVFSREYDPHTPIRLGLIALSDTDAGDNTGTMVETREVFLSRAGALLASTGLWKVGGAWHRVHFEIEGNNVIYFVSNGGQDHECNSDSNYWYLDQPDECRHTSSSVLRTFALGSIRSIITVSSIDTAYTFYILEQPPLVFPPLAGSLLLPNMRDDGPLPWGIPTQDQWRDLWRAWDLVTVGMIPQEMLLQKPINLRHKCLFYIGHIPTFVDMLLSKAIGGEPTEPKHFWDIFERGIDPDVDDPDHCHNHSVVPDADKDWPSLASILAFRDRVRTRLFLVYDQLLVGTRVITRNLARTLVMALEHEGFHVETLLYMLIQRAGTGALPPPGFTVPPWTLLSQQWDAHPPPLTATVVLGPAEVVLGHNDSEADDIVNVSVDHEFGWDNESPARGVLIGGFKVEWRPVSNDEFWAFLKTGGAVGLPKSWVEEQGEIKVRTLYGPVSMDVARHWPVLTSYDDLSLYAHWKGGRLPTEPELRMFFDVYEVGYEGGANVGFRNWHPVPATTGLAENGGRGSNGGVWEWTSTVFDGHEGLVPTNIFRGYSADFFDTKHQVVLGASYATIPRIAGRRTVRNFYQHNYQYAWIGGRVVYDLCS